jgi:hypothetical protein
MSSGLSPARAALCAAAQLLAVASSFGCTVTALQERERSIAVNECESDADCGGGSCSNDTCVSTQGELSELLFELTPTASGKAFAGAAFFKAVAGLAPEGGVVDLFPNAVAISGTVTHAPRASCTPTFLVDGTPELASNGTIPAAVTFTPALRAFGLSLPSPSGSTRRNQRREYEFGLNLPAGAYDVLIQPAPLVAEPMPPEGCRFPPQLIRGLCVEGGRPHLLLSMPVPSRVELSIIDRDQRLNDWVVDIVDKLTGKPISTPVLLALPSTSGGVSEYSVALDYLPALEYRECKQVEADTSNDLVRLAPPAGVVAPTFLFGRSALALFSPDEGRIDQLPALSEPVIVEGRVFSGPSQNPQRATITFVADALLGVPTGVLASFVRTVETAADGSFEVELLPGTYRVQAAPVAGAALRVAASSSWEIAPTPAIQGGRAIDLVPAIVLAGNAFAPTGEGARGANVVAEASASEVPNDVLTNALRGVRLAPRASSAVITDSAGSFALSADAGVFDFFVRPPDGSGFAWLVMPRLSLSDALDARWLPELWLPLPVLYKVDAGESAAVAAQLTGARVRAFAPVDAQGRPTSYAAATAFLPVAEARLDQNARATLAVPASLQPAP